MLFLYNTTNYKSNITSSTPWKNFYSGVKFNAICAIQKNTRNPNIPNTWEIVHIS